jgi:hypothetical protein
MRTRSFLVPALLLGAVLTSCTDVEVTNPNAPDSETYWASATDAIQGLNAAYNGLEQNGVYGRWLGFPTDIRADDGKSNSPWTDLANWNKFSFNAYDFEPNHAIWFEHYATIFRANQVIAHVPEIDMDAALRDRIVGEAKFIRGLMYYNLINLYGGENLPLQTEVSVAGEMPETPGADAIWAQIEKDFTEAAGVLPTSYSGSDVGRATSGAAQGMLGKALMMQRKWQQAADVLGPLIASDRYQLIPDYGTLFRYEGNNTQEGLFEVQFGSRGTLSQGVRGLNQGKFFGPCGPSWCDGEPTTWLLNQFLQEKTTSGDWDPRLAATLFWQPTEMAYGQTMAQRYADRYADAARLARGDSVVFWKKYTEYWLNTTDQDYDAPLTFKVLRYADVLLLQAEALNELGQTDAALPFINRVRARVDLAPIPAGLSQQAMRDRILHERLLEFADEHQRWLDLERQNLLTAAYLPVLQSHDPEFNFFTVGKGELLPIPTPEVNLNPNVDQNPGW